MSSIAALNKKKVCINPFGRKKCSSNRRQVTDWMIKKNSALTSNDYICDTCRNQMRPLPDCSTVVSSNLEDAEKIDETYEEDIHEDIDDNADDESFFSKDAAVDSLNKFLNEVDISPVKQEQLCLKKYCNSKMSDIVNVLKSTIFEKYEPDKKNNDGDIMLQQLKHKIAQSSDKKEKVKLLTLVPRTWSTAKTAHEFEGVTNYMVHKAKGLFDNDGILTSPPKKKGKALSCETKSLVRIFYLDDDFSRLMPGKKDFVSVKENGVRRHEQKRLVLCNLKELYSLFGTQYPNNLIGFSTFAALRPENCILAGASGTHTVCVCSIHQNPILMIDASKRSLSNETRIDFNYKSFLNTIVCDEPTRECYFAQCDECPGTEHLRKLLIDGFDSEGMERIEYKQWTTTDRSSLETLVKTIEQFTESLLEQLMSLLKHSFIAKKQSEYLNYLKKNLPDGCVLVLGDFAENMSFVVQDEVQGFHWNNDQATIHPMVCYYKNSEGVLHSENFVPLSECLKHDTTLVHVFLERLVNFLKSKLNPVKLIYFTDGCAAQYKNRNNFYNMTLHEHDFGVAAEWHFYATSHGKSACDGLGGTIKRLVAKASLQRPLNNQILTPLQMFDWVKSNISGMNFVFVTNEEYVDAQPKMEKRYQKTVVLDGTRSFHSFIPVSEGIVKVKVFSTDEDHYFKRVVKLKSEMETGIMLPNVKMMA